MIETDATGTDASETDATEADATETATDCEWMRLSISIFCCLVFLTLVGSLTFAIRQGQKTRRSPSPGFNFRNNGGGGPVIEDIDLDGSNRMDVI